MALDPAAVTNNANSKLCRIDMVSSNTGLSSPERMELIMRICAEYDSGTAGSTERHRAAKTAEEFRDG